MTRYDPQSAPNLTFFAQPYDISAAGFYFTSHEEYRHKATRCRNSFGQPVEEFEIQIIEAKPMDIALTEAVGLHQGNIADLINAIGEWSADDKLRVILAVEDCGYAFDIAADDPALVDVEIYHLDSLRELAVEFVNEGVMGEIPDALIWYFDYDAFARDLAMDYSETCIAGERLVYRCG